MLARLFAVPRYTSAFLHLHIYIYIYIHKRVDLIQSFVSAFGIGIFNKEESFTAL